MEIINEEKDNYFRICSFESKYFVEKEKLAIFISLIIILIVLSFLSSYFIGIFIGKMQINYFILNELNSKKINYKFQKFSNKKIFATNKC